MPNYRQQSNHGQVTRGIAIFAGLLLERESRLDCRGTSKQMDNTDSESMTYIKPFLTALGRKLPDIPIVMHDERFTSVLAHKAMIEGGAKKKQRQDKAIIDAISATIILQSYMESQRNLNI